MANINWHGVYPALLTPFDKNDRVDFEMYKTNVDAQVSAGVDGIIIGGSLGETSTLLSEEKRDLLVYSKGIVPSALPVIVNIAEQSTKVAVALAREAEANGADGLMLLPPMRYKADERETVAFFKAVAESTSLPILLYNNPVDYKIEITLDMFEQMLDNQNIQAVKESTRNTMNVTRMLNRFGERYKVLTGVDPIALESLLLGAHGWVAGLVDAFPRETVAIYRLVKAGRIDDAVAINRWFLPLCELDIHPKLVQYIKLAAKATGIGTEYVRAPRLVLEGAERAAVQKVIDDALATRPELPDYLNLQNFSNAEWA
ncbi:dihydrodipicolinate synthase family protein [Flavihumibacter stibioxidans]|uniref:Dihydrodipicolinate synthase family protein n=1 Tax=Flavihumibacter stibioxidans TaxID=1834163 RepID=A0ABR7MA41_9BACT|nr:dihydrodipicolinate synthase family protein [Flavihumibacter stibioxidans]MBC6491922.1 dihydrodipicolinate synthase family protein [Flavihumibacter stibioxidans]